MWTDKYIGLPYKEHGRDTDGLDCFGLARMVYKNELDVDLPDFNIGFNKTKNKDLYKHIVTDLDDFISNESKKWIDIKELDDKPKDFDFVLIRMMGYVIHIGIFIAPNKILHCYDGIDSVLENIEPRWTSKIEKIVRWKKHS